MYTKRLLAVSLLLFGLVAILGVVYWTLAPILKRQDAVSRESAQPGSSPKPPATISKPQARDSRSVTTDEQLSLLLRQRAGQFAVRQGSYTNSDGFSSLRDTYLDVSPALKNFYQGEQERLLKEHPTTQGSWTQTMRALSSRVVSSEPIGNQTDVVVAVQAQQIVEAGSAPAQISYQEVRVTMTRLGDRWIASRVEARPLSL